MRNLIHLVKRLHIFLLFLALQLIALNFVIRNHFYHKTAFINASNGVIGSIYDKRARLSEYLKLSEINDNLSLENSMLRSSSDDSYLHIDTTTRVVDDSLMKQRYRYHSARVVNSSINRMTNYITLDQGSVAGIRKDMGVIANNSIVGYVTNVSEHFSVVMPILHRSFNTSVHVKHSGDIGFLRWNTSAPDPELAMITGMPKHVNVEPGDTILTTGFSDYFPANLLAGFVTNVESNDDENEYRITIELSTSFRKLHYVQVVENLMLPEQKQLEQKALEQFGDDHSK